MTCGIWAWTEKGFFDDVAELTSIPLDPVVVILSIGFVMFILSFSGCLGALRENICLLKFVSTSKRDASSRWSFLLNSAWGSIETRVIEKLHPTLLCEKIIFSTLKRFQPQ